MRYQRVIFDTNASLNTVTKRKTCLLHSDVNQQHNSSIPLPVLLFASPKKTWGGGLTLGTQY